MRDTSCFGHQLKPFHSKTKKTVTLQNFLQKTFAQNVPLHKENKIMTTLAENFSLKRQKRGKFPTKNSKSFFSLQNIPLDTFPGCHLRDIQR